MNLVVKGHICLNTYTTKNNAAWLLSGGTCKFAGMFQDTRKRRRRRMIGLSHGSVINSTDKQEEVLTTFLETRQCNSNRRDGGGTSKSWWHVHKRSELCRTCPSLPLHFYHGALILTKLSQNLVPEANQATHTQPSRRRACSELNDLVGRSKGAEEIP